MARVNEIICNRCDEPITTFRVTGVSATLAWAKIMIHSPEMAKGFAADRIDLCVSCYNDFIQFLEEK